MVRVVEPVKGLVEERWWVMRKWRVRMRVRMEVMTCCGRLLIFVLEAERVLQGRTYFLRLEPRRGHATSRGGHWSSILGLGNRL